MPLTDQDAARAQDSRDAERVALPLTTYRRLPAAVKIRLQQLASERDEAQRQLAVASDPDGVDAAAPALAIADPNFRRVGLPSRAGSVHVRFRLADPPPDTAAADERMPFTGDYRAPFVDVELDCDPDGSRTLEVSCSGDYALLVAPRSSNTVRVRPHRLH